MKPEYLSELQIIVGHLADDDEFMMADNHRATKAILEEIDLLAGLERLARAQLSESVAVARRLHLSWAAIAASTGTARQSAHRRWYSVTDWNDTPGADVP